MITKTLVAYIVLGVLVMAAFGAAQPVSDDAIHDNVMRKLANDSIVKGAGFDVAVTAGVVTLRGKVESAKQKERAAKLAKGIKGVKNVDNQLVVTRQGGR